MSRFVEKMIRIKIIFNRLLRLIKTVQKPDVVYDKSVSHGLKVHLGAGPVNIQGWINVDARSYDHTHLVAKSFDLEEFSDGAISELYMCHVLEHFSFAEAETLLKNLKRKLCIGGVMRISVPSFDQLIYVYSNSDIGVVKHAIMGGQDYEYNFHKSIYNHSSLVNLLEECGYTDVVIWDTETDFGVDLGDWSNKSFPSRNGQIKISLNLKGRNEGT